jgi:TRAP-type C4-dicarboxylate transport system permease small subunit
MSMPSILVTTSPPKVAVRQHATADDVVHRFWISLGVAVAFAIALALAIYGFDYYTLDATQRALSPKHDLLKPSGTIGVRLGLFGVALFLLLYLYAIRKHWKWLAKQGNTRHWLDFHVLLGIFAPVVVTFHSSFKFRGIAGVAYWIMVIVALSGFVGRYLYSQIPRSLGAVEVTLKELREQIESHSQELGAQKVLSAADLAPLLQLPSAAVVASLSLPGALWLALRYDARHAWRLRALRKKALRTAGKREDYGGMLRSTSAQVEHVIECVREQAALTKKSVLLSKTQQLFQLWHVIHRPFSYSFVIFGGIHVVVELLLGYY